MFFGLFKKKKTFSDPMKYLVVGLGNMGAEYEDTRHNVGFEILDIIASELNAEWSHKKLGDLSKIRYRGRTIILLKPSTYMNRSGKSIHYWMQKEKIAPENLFVIVDDLNIDFGRIRIRKKGSDGGHNGLKDIQSYIGTNFARLRFGIGGQFKTGSQVNFVLGKWTDDEREKLQDLMHKSVQAIKAFSHVGIGQTMSQFNN